MSWKKVKLGEFLKVRDNRFKPNDKAIADLKRIDKIDFSGEIFISDKPSNTDMILIKKGDLVISGINVEKGAMAVYTGEEDITATIHYSSYSFDENRTDIEFLKSFLKSIEFKNALKEQVPGGIKTEIKPKHILPLVVEIPTDIKDQRELVKLLHNRNSKVDAISNELTNQLSLVKKLRQQLLQDAVQGKLVKQDPKDQPASELLKKIKAEKEKLIAEKKFKKETELPPIKPEEIPFEIPENWNWCRLNDIISILGDGLHGTPNYDSNGAYYFINGNNLINGKIEIKENTKKVSESEYLKHRKILISNTVFVSINGTLGNLAYYNGEKIILGKSACYFNLHPEILREYIGIYIKSSYFLKYAVDVASETTIKNVSLKSMRLLPVPFPPLAEQNRIVKKLDELMQNCNKLEASIKQSESQNEKLLQQVLREALRKEPVGA